MLFIYRSLHSGLNQEKPWLRDNIFHTRCTSHGKVCNLIVDSGSCTNAVSEEMVSKLRLKTELIPKPYKIHWFQKGEGLKITRSALYLFQLERIIGMIFGAMLWTCVISF